ncbi:putative ABC transporter substrate-binding protein [Bradyrhizobium cosmicum]|uniref:ABC transporter substrate-binding protein n=1 Tax=Bradyrhizobium cosmicum TaxID=1404864 RepID=A0AAI8MIB1_9BRAD|nr:putative ABC transporter substrate-binding protein [Bradyrhizobium cosmicum]
MATTYPGSFDEAFRSVVGPAFKKASDSSVTFTPLLGVDQIGKIQASRNAPPFDVVLFDEGPLIPAIASGVLEKFPVEQSKSYANIPSAFRHPDGYAPVITCQLIGIAYNPKKITTPPTSWEDLWKPEYKGRVGITGLGSSLGTAFMVEIAKLNGGSETNIEPAFEAIKKLLPNVGAIAASPGALAALFQQGEIDIAFNFWNNVALLAAKGVDIAFAKPKSGAVVIRTSAQIVKNNQDPKLVLDYLDTVMSVDTQKGIEAAPWVMMPTNGKVPLTGANLTVAKSVDDLVANNVLLDWTKFQSLRGEWITRFSKEVKI